MATLVSLVTPAYNQAEFLAATLDSVLGQMHANLDYRVIDDGSTDATPDVLARYATRVRAERQSNMGQAATLNRAWAEAPGDYLGYLSSDDLLDPTALARAAAVLDADTNIVCVFPNADWIDPAGRVIRRAVCRPFDLDETVITQACFIGPGALFRASAFRAVGGWRTDLRLAPDREFWMRLANIGRFHMIPDSLAGYRMHPRSLSFRVASEAQSREYLRVLDDYFARPDTPPRLMARRDEAYARANLLIARERFRATDLARGRHYWRAARKLDPSLGGFATRAALARALVARPVRLAQARLRQAFG